jgi:hypothetical protein
MINLPNVTLVTIDGLAKNEDHLKALKYSTQNINFGSVKYFSPNNLGKSDFYSFIKIPKLSYEEYNKFCITELNEYVETDYVLIVQDDGFIINPHLWNNDFFKYDYIGGPWPKEHLFFNTKRWPMIHEKLIESDVSYHVGNGGFSFRSKKLCEKVKHMYQDEFLNIPEDALICIGFRKILESFGLTFAPFELARLFSCETLIVENVYTNTTSTFGFHGRDTHRLDVDRLNSISLI